MGVFITWALATVYVALGMIGVACAAFIVTVFISSLITLAAAAMDPDA